MERWDLVSVRAAESAQTWIETYLAVPEWQNPGLLRRVREYATVWEGPILVRLDSLIRIAGPGSSHPFPQDPERWSADVAKIVALGITPDSLPPLILWRVDEGLNVADGNHRLDALEACGYEEAWAFVSPYPLREGARERWISEHGAVLDYAPASADGTC